MVGYSLAALVFQLPCSSTPASSWWWRVVWGHLPPAPGRLRKRSRSAGNATARRVVVFLEGAPQVRWSNVMVSTLG
eukprot:9362990-Pyramimonas_sp.AAC.1